MRVWLLSLSISSLRFIHVVEYIYSSFLFIAELDFIVCLHHCVHISPHLLMDIRGVSCFEAILTKAVMTFIYKSLS